MKDLLPPLTSGLIAVLVGFASTAALIYQAATASGATAEQAGMWVTAVLIGSGIVSIYFSLRYRMPIFATWSTAGSALLAVSSGFTLPQVIGALILNGVLITLVGLTGVFEKSLRKIPISLASAMLAGILLRFGLEVFLSMKTKPEMVLGILATYLFAKRFYGRYAVLITLVVGFTLAAVLGELSLHGFTFQWPQMIPTVPEFSISAFLSLALPIFIVTMASQNLPGVIAMRNAGYEPPISKVLVGTGAVTTLLAPFGVFALNFSAITAAICMGPEAHEDKNRRYLATTFAGVFYILLGILGGTVGVLLAELPKELILTIAGIALMPTIGNSLHLAMIQEREREAALITFLVTASGVSFFGVGSSLWGIVIGFIALVLSHRQKRLS